MIFNVIKKIIGIERDSKIQGAAGVLKYAADILLYFAVLFYLIVTGVLLPLYLPGYDSLGTDKGQFWVKGILFSGKILLIPLAFYVLYVIVRVMTSGGKAGKICFPKRTSFTRTDIWAVLFCVSVIISYALSEEKQIALYGERGWYLGTISYLSLGIGVLVIPRLGKAKNPIIPFIMVTSFAASMIGVIMDFAGNVLGAEGWDAGKVSTIGNPNWFCGYLVTVMFAGVAAFYFRREGGVRKYIAYVPCLIVYMIVTFYMMIAQGSASAYLASWAVLLAMLMIAGKEPDAVHDITFVCMIFAISNALHAVYIAAGGVSRPNDPVGRLLENPVFAVLMLATCVVVNRVAGSYLKKGKNKVNVNIGKVLAIITGCAVLVFAFLLIINTVTGSGFLGKEGSLFWFDYHWGSSRGATLSLGMEVFRGMTPFEKLFGKGPDTFYSFMISGRFPETAAKSNEYFGGARLTNTHCEFLTMLVNTGIAGTVTFYGLMISVMIKGFRTRSVTALACSLGILAYIINNIFSFQTAVNVSQLALILGFGAWAVMCDKSEDR